MVRLLRIPGKLRKHVESCYTANDTTRRARTGPAEFIRRRLQWYLSSIDRLLVHIIWHHDDVHRSHKENSYTSNSAVKRAYASAVLANISISDNNQLFILLFGS